MTAWCCRSRGACKYCPHVTRQTGIQLQDTATYGDPVLARQTFGLSGDIYIGALAADSPGARTGLTVNTTVIAIGGHPLSAIPAPRARRPVCALARGSGHARTGSRA